MKKKESEIYFEGSPGVKIGIEEDFNLFIYDHGDQKSISISKKDSEDCIHFIVCDTGAFEIQVGAENNFILGSDKFIATYGDSLKITPEKNTPIFILQISFKMLHQMVLGEIETIGSLFNNNKQPELNFKIANTQFLHYAVVKPIHLKHGMIYLKSKAYELLSILTHRLSEENKKSCPCNLNKDDVEKLMQAKYIFENHITEPLLPSQVSGMVNLSFPKLKNGFKQTFGVSIHEYIINYKLMLSEQLLISKKHSVKEIALQIGYSTSSHFIAAFKKKFGTTPKKYVMRLN